MKIQITDRELWITKVNTASVNILQHRILHDKSYEKQWRKRWILPDRKDSEYPIADNWNPEYPCADGWQTMNILRNLVLAIESKGTGEIWLDTEELRMIEAWL